MLLLQKTSYIFIAIVVGFIFHSCNIPAGWLIGSLVTGVFCGIFIKQFQFKHFSFKVALAFVGANISLLLKLNTLKVVHQLFIPLFITIFITIIAGYVFGIVLYKTTNYIDKITAFFCCIPGGASEIIGISGQYGADERLVAAFHTVRITFFTISIPLIIGYLHPVTEVPPMKETTISFNYSQLVFFGVVILITILLDKTLNIPGGTLIFSIFTGFLLREFMIDIEHVPRFVAGVGQALIGALVGIRFDREVVHKLWNVGPITILIISMFFGLTLLTTFIFKLMTDLPYATSLISTVPAGAAEMSVTAVALEVNPTIVATLHIIRVISIFLMLPILLKVFNHFNKNSV